MVLKCVLSHFKPFKHMLFFNHTFYFFFEGFPYEKSQVKYKFDIHSDSVNNSQSFSSGLQLLD